MSSTAFSAPMALVYGGPAGDQLVGWATDIQVTERRTNVPVKPLGTIYTQQLCTTMADYSMSVGKVFIKEASLSDLNIFIQGSSDEVVLAEDLTFISYDKLTNKPVLEMRGCRAAGRTYSLQRGGIMTEGANYDVLQLRVHGASNP